MDHRQGHRFGMPVHQTDAEREFADDREGHIGVLNQDLNEAEAGGGGVVAVKDDWNQVFK